MHREAWRAAIHRVAKSQTWLSDWTVIEYTKEYTKELLAHVCVYTCTHRGTYRVYIKKPFRNTEGDWETPTHAHLITVGSIPKGKIPESKVMKAFRAFVTLCHFTLQKSGNGILQLAFLESLWYYWTGVWLLKSITSAPTPMEQLQKPRRFCCLTIKMGKLATCSSSHLCPFTMICQYPLSYVSVLKIGYFSFYSSLYLRTIHIYYVYNQCDSRLWCVYGIIY